MKQDEGKSSFITEARREQIMAAAIQTLDEIGYVKASLAQIASRAGISTALISYHFADKNDLMNHLLMKLIERSTAYILEKVHQESTPQEKLSTFIVASLAYQGTHPAHNTALLEIIFNARTPDNTPYYRLGDDEDELILQELKQILLDGQEQEFFGAFDVHVMASMIQGAIGEYMPISAVTRKVDLETYSSQLVKIINQAVKAD
jgi:TetR/AcrR family transcriptional repressor of bet genes